MGIMVMKLKNGEDVIADVVDDGQGEEIELKCPIQMVLTEEGVLMGPFCQFTKDRNIKLRRDYVVFMAAPNDQIRNGFNEKYGNGLVVASPGQAAGLKLHV